MMFTGLVEQMRDGLGVPFKAAVFLSERACQRAVRAVLGYATDGEKHV
jgi:hypothetical protein